MIGEDLLTLLLRVLLSMKTFFTLIVVNIIKKFMYTGQHDDVEEKMYVNDGDIDL